MYPVPRRLSSQHCGLEEEEGLDDRTLKKRQGEDKKIDIIGLDKFFDGQRDQSGKRIVHVQANWNAQKRSFFLCSH